MKTKINVCTETEIKMPRRQTHLDVYKCIASGKMIKLPKSGICIDFKKKKLYSIEFLLLHSKKRRNAPWCILTQVSEIIVRWVFHLQIHRNHTERFVGVGKLRSSIFSGLQSYQTPTIFDNFAVFESTFLSLQCYALILWEVCFFQSYQIDMKIEHFGLNSLGFILWSD